MNISRKEILKYLHAQCRVEGHIVGVAAGSGIVANCAALGGADFVLALSAGVLRQMGRSSLSCYMCYSNSNEITREYAVRELRPLLPKTPILLGYNATEPCESMADAIRWVKDAGYEGIVNFPTVGLIDGQFREALEEEGVCYRQEVEAIRLAHEMDLFTIAYVFDEQQARWMLEAGADVICAHFGFALGGVLGAKESKSLTEAARFAKRIFDVCEEMRSNALRMVYGGPIITPIDAQFFYDNTSCQGIIGGSCFDRVPIERSVYNTTLAFKNVGDFDVNNKYYKILSGEAKSYDYVKYIQDYITENYSKPIQLKEIALTIHVSKSYLSTLFKNKTGSNFTEYLINYRMNRACDILKHQSVSVKKTAELVGYTDYVQFCKIFKKKVGQTPGEYRKANRK